METARSSWPWFRSRRGFAVGGRDPEGVAAERWATAKRRPSLCVRRQRRTSHEDVTGGRSMSLYFTTGGIFGSKQAGLSFFKL